MFSMGSWLQVIPRVAKSVSSPVRPARCSFWLRGSLTAALAASRSGVLSGKASGCPLPGVRRRRAVVGGAWLAVGAGDGELAVAAAGEGCAPIAASAPGGSDTQEESPKS